MTDATGGSEWGVAATMAVGEGSTVFALPAVSAVSKDPFVCLATSAVDRLQAIVFFSTGPNGRSLQGSDTDL